MALPTDVQDRVFTTLVQGTGLKSKNIQLIDKPVAAGLGLGLDVTQAQGVMLAVISKRAGRPRAILRPQISRFVSVSPGIYPNSFFRISAVLLPIK